MVNHTRISIQRVIEWLCGYRKSILLCILVCFYIGCLSELGLWVFNLFLCVTYHWAILSRVVIWEQALQTTVYVGGIHPQGLS